MKKIRIALVDDQKIFRQSLSILLSAIPHHELVMEAEDGAECLQKLKTMPLLPHIVLLDMEMPTMDGIELNEHLQKFYPDLKRIILSAYSKEPLIAHMIEAGASAYLIKKCDKIELYTAINSVFENGFYINEHTMQAIQRSSIQKGNIIKKVNGIPIELTIREREVLQCICKECSNAEIAEKLFISVRTVEGHRNNLLLKTGCKNTAGLVLFAIKHKIFELVY